jgi:hypothetical protein
MKYKIADNIIKQATRCDKNLVCLSGDGGPYCTVMDYMVGNEEEAALIECPKESACPYRASFGETHICECPVRMEIYKIYGK